MEVKKDGDEEHFNLCIEKQLLHLISDDNQNPDARSRISKDPLYLFKLFHGSCNCTKSSCSEPRVQKSNQHRKIEMVHHFKKVLKPKGGNGTGVFIPKPAGDLNRRNNLKQPGSW